jgi:hypothetical protein
MMSDIETVPGPKLSQKYAGIGKREIKAPGKISKIQSDMPGNGPRLL